LLPFIAGFFLSAWRFSADDAIGGLALGLGGTLAMIGLGVMSRNAP
jgi:hypothetical protein